MTLLDGKVAIVTGAAGAIGREEVLALAGEGARVVVNNRLSGEETPRANRVKALVAEVRDAGGQAVESYDDVADWRGAEALICRAVDAFGTLDVLVNNAGHLWDKSFADLDEHDWDEGARVNLKGHAAPIHFAARYWTDAGPAPEQGRAIVNTGSQAGLYGRPNRAVYSAAKGAITSLTLALAQELRPLGIRCNAIVPRARSRQTQILERESLTPAENGFDRWSPAHIAPAVCWLASDAARHVTGRIFIVFGGSVWLMQPPGIAAQMDRAGAWTGGDLADRGRELFADPGLEWETGPMSARKMVSLRAEDDRVTGLDGGGRWRPPVPAPARGESDGAATPSDLGAGDLGAAERLHAGLGLSLLAQSLIRGLPVETAVGQVVVVGVLPLLEASVEDVDVVDDDTIEQR